MCTRAVSQYTVTTACECVMVALRCAQKYVSDILFLQYTHPSAMVTVHCDTALVHRKVRLRHTFSAVHTP